MFIVAAAILLFFSVNSFAAFNHDPTLTWHTLHTRHFNIHFHNGEDRLARKLAAIAEKVHDKVSVFIDWQPETPTDIILTDRNDITNASATPFPNNQITMFTSPPDDLNTVEDYNNWMEILLTHEYTHILHLDKATKTPKKFRSIFGRIVPWLFPNTLQPLWEIEGLATYVETDDELGVGRGQSSLYQMYMRTEMDNGLKPLRQVNQPVSSWPSGTTRYLYGVYFFRFVRDKYGEDKVRLLVEEHSKHIIPYMINTTASRVLGKDLDALWKEFTSYLQEIFGDQLKKIRAEGIQAGNPVTSSGYQTTHPRIMPNGDLYYYKNDHQSEPVIMLLRKGAKTAIPFTEARSGRFDIHPEKGILIAQLDSVRNVNLVSDLYRVDLKTGKATQLTHGGRYRFGAWSTDGQNIIAVQNKLGHSSLVLLDGNGKKTLTLWKGTNNEVISEFDVSPDGKHLVASVWRKTINNTDFENEKTTGNWNLEQFDLETKQWKKLLDSANIEMHPRYNSNGDSILFVADYAGIYNVHELKLATKQVITLTNLLTGAQHPALSNDGGTLYYTGYGSDGFNIFSMNMANRNQLTIPSTMTPPAKKDVAPQSAEDKYSVIDSSSIVTEYSPLDSVKPTWWFPHLLIEDDRQEIGLFTGGSDALRRHNYFVVAGYDLENNWLIGDLTYIYDRWDPTVKLRSTHRSNIFRNADSSLQRIRFTDTLTAEFVFPFIKYDSQWGIHTAAVIEKNYDERLAAGSIPAPSFRNSLAGLAFSFNSTRRYPVSISSSNGSRAKLVFENYDVFDSFFTGNVYTTNWQEFFHLGKQQVLAVDFTLGIGNDNPSLFRLGGSSSESFGNPLSQSTTTIFNRRKYSLRGYPEGIPSLIGRRMAVANIEWRFPLVKLERGIMMPLPIGIHQIHASTFINIGEAWNNRDDRESAKTAAGFEINTEVVFGYSIRFNVRAGFAHGFAKEGTNQSYIKIGTSF